jgi:hypothetical protein
MPIKLSYACTFCLYIPSHVLVSSSMSFQSLLPFCLYSSSSLLPLNLYPFLFLHMFYFISLFSPLIYFYLTPCLPSICLTLFLLISSLYTDQYLFVLSLSMSFFASPSLLSLRALQRKSHICIPFLGIARPQPQF